MRVTNAATYKSFNSSINDVHSKLNKSMNKITSGRAYESSAENPAAYYEGKKIDNQYQDTITKMSLVTDIKNRLYQQELGARSIQDSLGEARLKLEYIRSDSNNGNMQTVETVRDDLLQKQQEMVTALNSQYQDHYIYGGNDISTPPFSLSSDGMELTFTHQFPGETGVTKINMKLEENNGVFSYKYSYEDPQGNVVNTEADVLKKIKQAMSEQGRVDIGYGSIMDKNSLLDTNTGGLNLLTGISSDAVKANISDAVLKERLLNNPIALAGKGVHALNEYVAGGSKSDFSESLSNTMTDMTTTGHSISTVYSDLGNKYALTESTYDKLSSIKLALTEQYTDKLGADRYESIMEMYSYQQSYSASLQLASNMMKSSLFDFMR